MSETARAMAVVNAVWTQWPAAVIEIGQCRGEVAVWINDPNDPDYMLFDGTGPTYVAALLDLGAKLPVDAPDSSVRGDGGADE